MMQHWRRLLPDRSQVVILVGVLAVLYATVSFVNLAVAKSHATQERQAAEQRMASLLDQSQRLKDSLGQAQRGEHVDLLAREYFNLARKGERVAVLEERPSGQQNYLQSEPPYWSDWWNRLIQP